MNEAALALCQTPSRTNWRRLCDLLDTNQEAQHDVAPLKAALSHWPAEYRTMPGRWWRRLSHNDESPFLSLVTCIDLVQFASESSGSFSWSRSPTLEDISIFRLYDERLGDEGAEAFASSRYLKSVAELSLATEIKERGGVALANAENLSNVTTLNLQRNQLNEVAIQALVASPYLKNLRALHLGRNKLSASSIDALAAHSFALQKLDLDCTGVSDEMIERLCASGALRGLRELNLSNNALGVRGCRALSRCEDMASLEILFMHSCQLTDEAATELLDGPGLKKLHNLALSQNQLTEVSVDRLAACEGLSTLTELDVCHNPFDVAQAERQLQASIFLEKLKRLCV